MRFPKPYLLGGDDDDLQLAMCEDWCKLFRCCLVGDLERYLSSKSTTGTVLLFVEDVKLLRIT